uniref:Uncharacterized protein n=1 Tax=Clastoptera arizonana TaxID=38151 RepID=A0A1B6DES8_9HEMI
MSGVLTKCMAISSKYPIIRGMVSYGISWPLGSLIQQSLSDDKELDFVKAAKFGLYGSCFVAPTFYTWLTVAGAMFPLVTLRSALAKVKIIFFLKDFIQPKNML